MIELAQNQLVFHFPEIHEDARCTVEFQRTLRIPDDNREYALPPGLGRFPICHVDDHKNKVPEDWITRGGVFLPMYQRASCQGVGRLNQDSFWKQYNDV